MSAFFLYSQGYRTQTKEENPEATFGEIVSLEKYHRVRICTDWLLFDGYGYFVFEGFVNIELVALAVMCAQSLVTLCIAVL
jgi:hypothetical protein